MSNLSIWLKVMCVCCIAVVAVVIAGCGEEPEAVEKGPSYAELIVTYNAELAALDRLEEKKEKLVKELEGIGIPTEQDAIKALGGLLGPAAQSGANANPAVPADPNAALDQAVGQAQSTHDAAAGLLQQFGNQATVDPKTAKKQEEERQRIQGELDALEKEIASQKERVERARAARDAAEAAEAKANKK